ncbi:MAG TPA: biotin/lipoyl-binding protein, partial [Candidatus Krumholzibacterium sp.]|nr:biotin/lipoyl-binding protein [Candidatus Krumholzibacterium sp.]
MTDTKQSDLSRLRIDRNNPPSEGPGPRSRGALVLYLVGGAVTVLAMLFLGRALLQEPEEVETTLVTYVSPAASQSLLTASGYVVAQRKAAIASKATGRIVALYYKEGDRVRKGDIIAKIESEDVEAALEQARAERAVAEA